MVTMLAAAIAGALSLASPEARSVWLNRPASPEQVAQGVYFGGDARFRLPVQGRHLVEIGIGALEEAKESFVLDSGGVEVDGRYRIKTTETRLRPKRRLQRIDLLAVVDAGNELAVRTDSPRYVLFEIRWTPEKEFEERIVPELRSKARQLWERPLFGGAAFSRRARLQEIYERLALSRQPEAKREGWIGLARTLYWVAAENHEPFDRQRAAEAFAEALKLTPDDAILRQTVSASCLDLNDSSGRLPKGPWCEQVKPLPWEVPVPSAPPGAPAWAVAQRKLAARIEAITRWWVEKRQQPNGEIGGGWGDDVEILRQWGPQALGLGSAVAARGIRVMADGLWRSGTIVNGYDRQISDVEHSSEPTTDTQPLLAALNPDDPEAVRRLAETAACSEHWIAQQPDGRWRFRGSWFNCREVDPAPERAVDVHLNTRAMGPALWHAYLTRDPKLVQRLVRWAESWVEAMRSTAHGKPPGIFPPVVRSADGSYLIGGSKRWDQPAAEWDYFQWSGRAQESLSSLLLALHDLTGEKKWLDAAAESVACEAAPQDLCRQVRESPEAWYEWQRRTGKRAWPAEQEILDRMATQALQAEAKYGVNFEMFTSEALYTDRVYYPMPIEYRQYLFGGETPRGDRYPTFAVTWPVANGEFARAVLDATATRLKLRLYNFETRELKVPVRVWRLEPGRYRWDGGEITVKRRAQVVEFAIPSRREVAIDLRRIAE